MPVVQTGSMREHYSRHVVEHFQSEAFLRLAYVDAYLGPEIASFDRLAWPSKVRKEPRYWACDEHGSRRECSTLSQLRLLVEDPAFVSTQISSYFMVAGEHYGASVLFVRLHALRKQAHPEQWKLHVQISGSNQALVIGSRDQAERIVKSAVASDADQLEKKVAFAFEQPQKSLVRRVWARLGENVLGNVVATVIVTGGGSAIAWWAARFLG